MKGYVLDPKDLFYTIEGAKSRDAGTAYLWSARSAGMCAIEGVVYNAQASRPALLVSPEGVASIRWDPTQAEVAAAKLTIGAELIPLHEGKIAVASHSGSRVDRMLIGLLPDGKLVHFYVAKATLRAAGLVAKSLGCVSAIQLVEGDTNAPTRTAVGAHKATPLPAKVFVLDPGHGGSDPGAVGNGIVERDWNLTEAKLLYKALESYDVTVLMTRFTDEETVPLVDRSELANAAGADLFLSMHHNASNNKGYGYEDFVYLKPTAGCLRYQELIQKHLAPVLAEFKIYNRGAKKGDFHVIRETRSPSVLTEWLFVDQAADAAIIKNPTATAKYVSALLSATVEYLGVGKKAAAPPPMKIYRVQAGAFTDKAKAEALRDELIKLGFDAFVAE